jgi:hypothetical protein
MKIGLVQASEELCHELMVAVIEEHLHENLKLAIFTTFLLLTWIF